MKFDHGLARKMVPQIEDSASILTATFATPPARDGTGKAGKHPLKSSRFNNSYGRLEFAETKELIMATSADLGKTLEKFVTKLVATGRYHSKSEVLREGVRLIQERETRLAALDASIARGLADADAGRVKSTSEVFGKLESRLKGQAKAARR
jgi:antitoxin ParD1/3/4